MKKFLNEFFKRLIKPTVYAPVIGFTITVLVSSGTINIGDSSTAEITEKIIALIGALLTVIGVGNNPTDKENY